MSIWLPQLPLDRLRRQGDERLCGPFAMVSEIKNAWRITHINSIARDAGLQVGQSIPDARAICPALLTQPCDPIREDLMLRALRRWADKLSPIVSLDKPDGLFLDITGCAHLFGGEVAMINHARTALNDMRISSRIGVADTKSGAWAMARYSDTAATVAHTGRSSKFLAQLPIEALNLDPKAAQQLRRVGLKSVGQLYPIKTSELARRYGLELPESLAKALGRQPDPITPHQIDPVYAARMNLPEPIGLKGDLEEVLSRLTASVCARLIKDKKGARRFKLIVRCVDTGDQIIKIGFARPCFDKGQIKRQFERPLDQLKLKFGADWFRLVAEVIEPIRERQRIIGSEDVEKLEDIDQLITTLGNRIGFDRVRQFTPSQSHLPEREFATSEVADQPAIVTWPRSYRHRPVRLFRPERLRTIEAGRPPKVFQWRSEVYHGRTFTGPERITSEWWADEHDELRDYWIVDTQEGARLWLMTNPATRSPDWFVAGKFL